MVLEIPLVRAACLGDPVGIEEELIAGAELDGLPFGFGVREQPEREAAAGQHFDLAVRADHRRARAGYGRVQVISNGRMFAVRSG